MPEPDEGKLSSPVLRGPAPSNGGWPLGRNVKRIIWQQRFGVLKHFAFSGSSNVGSAPHAVFGSPESRDGVFIITSRV